MAGGIRRQAGSTSQNRLRELVFLQACERLGAHLETGATRGQYCLIARDFCLIFQDHPNLGLCIDTAHPPLARKYGWDATTGEGWTDSSYADMLSRLRSVPADKIFYVELADVLKPVVPLGKGSPFDEWREKAKSPRGDSFVWAICGRPVPLIGKDAGRGVVNEDDMGGAHVVETLKAVLSTGWRGGSFGSLQP
jgi:sugar phosphate isomerase/epimerase